MSKKVYFAGSIRAGREDADLYKLIIDHIQKTDPVLTEHVGDLSLSQFEQEADRDRLLYEQDTAWLRECDLLIGECTRPSLGVGYELAYAEKYGKPCYVFYRKKECELSAMIKGDPYYKVFPYEDTDEMLRIIDDILER
ncbi:MAG: nucleoside 2-deoxyribosyltransferase [Lachnospiraceae bacterium]|nr:nucleoside 2-deoxyribosyltransferase [Lachnospiraceae bacterium]